jgi:hypothetical protein
VTTADHTKVVSYRGEHLIDMRRSGNERRGTIRFDRNKAGLYGISGAADVETKIRKVLVQDYEAHLQKKWAALQVIDDARKAKLEAWKRMRLDALGSGRTYRYELETCWRNDWPEYTRVDVVADTPDAAREIVAEALRAFKLEVTQGAALAIPDEMYDFDVSISSFGPCGQVLELEKFSVTVIAIKWRYAVEIVDRARANFAKVAEAKPD